MSMLLSRITGPADLQPLTDEQLVQLAAELLDLDALVGLVGERSAALGHDDAIRDVIDAVTCYHHLAC